MDTTIIFMWKPDSELVMKFLVLAFVTACACASSSALEVDDPYKPFKGEFSVYSGELNDQGAPNMKERKISFIVTGAVAREMFESMYTDDKNSCLAAPGDRSRTKRDVWCTFSRKRGYVCYFGFDLRSGKSIAGGIC